MSLSANQLYRFDDFELQPSRRVMLRAGDKVPLAPKTFEVLLCLVRNSGRVVLKEEIFKTVWPDSFLEDSNLTQHIFWLRKALADKSGYIVTIPGRGYEFVAPVEVLPESAAGTPSAQAAPEAILRHTVELTTVIVEESTTQIQTQPQIHAASRTRPAWLVPAAVLTGVLLAGLSAWGAWHWMHRPVAGDHHEVVLADFENSTGDPDFSRSLRALLAIDLGQSPFLVVAADSDTRKVLKLMNRSPDSDLTPPVAREVCERLNDQVAVSGMIARFGQKYLIALTAADCSDGRQLAQTRAVADTRDEVIKAVDTAASAMRERLGEPLRTVQPSGHRLPLTHTFSLDALKAFGQARELQTKKRYKDAVPFYLQAVELDPNFANAYKLLANCYYNIGEAAKGKDAMAHAYQLRDQAEGADRLQITVMYEYWRDGDRHKAIRDYQTWTQMYSRQAYPWLLLGEFQASVGDMKDAIDSEKRALELDPSQPTAYDSLAEYQLDNGQLDEARATCLRAFARGIESTDLHTILRNVAFLQHDAAELEKQMTWFREQAPEDDREEAEAALDVSQGKIHNAVAHFSRAADLRKRDDLADAALQGFVGVPHLEADLGLVERARQHLKRYDPMPAMIEPALTDVAVAAAQAGKVDAADKILQNLIAKGEHDSDIHEQFAPECRAAIALAQGKPEQAIAALEPSSVVELTEPIVPTLRGQAYLALHQPELAQRAFQSLLAHPWVDALWDWVPLAHLGLARAYAMQGDQDAARREYQELFKLWPNPDPDLPVLIQARKELAALR